MHRLLPRLLLLPLTLAAILGGSACTLITNIVGSEKRDVYKFDHPFVVEDPPFRRSAEALGNPMVSGNRAVLLKNGDEIFPAMTREIREAKRTVNLETYIFQPDDAGRQFADAMIAAAKKGVEVRFLIDSWGSKLGDLEQPLKAAGVQVRKYRPVRLFSIYKVGKRTHRKLLIVDGRVAFTGGLGIDKRWLGNARNTNEWRDTQVRVEGPVAAQMQAVFSEDYDRGFAREMENMFQEDRKRCEEITYRVWKNRGAAKRLAELVFWVWEPYY